MTKTLTAQNLAKAYNGRPIIRDVSLELKSGEIVGLLGPNGAGKTTCFYMIAGIVNADAGKVLIDGKDLTRLSLSQRAKEGMGYLPQEPSIFRKLTVADNIDSILEIRPGLSRATRRELRFELMREFHITHLKNTLGMALSGGERRRVEIARALASEPAFILLDEPFAGVDPISVNDIKQIIRQLQNRGIGVLITDHNVRETLDICEKAYIVGEGRIVAEGPPAAVLNNKVVRDIYLGQDFTL